MRRISDVAYSVVTLFSVLPCGRQVPTVRYVTIHWQYASFLFIARGLQELFSCFFFYVP